MLSREAFANSEHRSSRRLGLNTSSQFSPLVRSRCSRQFLVASDLMRYTSCLQASKRIRLFAQAGEVPGTPQGAAGTPRGGLKRTASLIKPSGPDAALVGTPPP